jgi:uncharacterized protein YbcI
MQDSAAPPEGGPLMQDIAKAIVRAQHRRLGRGAPRARVVASEDLLIVVLQDPFTKSEQSLIADGRDAAVLELRAQSEQMLEAELVEIVERSTGCRVEAFLSAAHVAPQLVVEVFVLDRAVPGRTRLV